MRDTVTPNTNKILRLEDISILIASIAGYSYFHFNWGFFALLLFVFDISMLGYRINNRVGAFTYNLVHSYIGPMALMGLGLILHRDTAVAVALIWTAHIGIDRALGFGLKGATFGDTHLGSIRRHHPR